MRNTAFLAVGLALLIVQSNLFRLIGRLHIPGVTPSLLLPLVVFMGVHEYSMARGAALAFLLGYLLEKQSGQTYWDLLNTRILRPLNMSATTSRDLRVITPQRASAAPVLYSVWRTDPP